MEIQEPENGGAERGFAETGVGGPATATMPEVEEAFEEIEVDAPLVGIIMGSKNDKPKMQPAGEALQQHDIRYEVRVMSAHRDPEKVREYCHAARVPDVEVLHAGTARRNGDIVTAGGRVLNVTALGASPAEARSRAYEAANMISFDGMQMRTDIAERAASSVASP